MSIASLKTDLAQKILNTNDKGIIDHIKAIFDTHPEVNWFEELPEDVKISVKQGIKEADRGEGTPHTLVMKRVRKWVKK